MGEGEGGLTNPKIYVVIYEQPLGWTAGWVCKGWWWSWLACRRVEVYTGQQEGAQ